MARRRGRPGAYLMVDDNSGFTEYNSKLREDYWGNQTRIPLQRNLQEISQPLGDPYPVPIFRGSQYEQVNPCQFEVLPRYIGKTTIPFPRDSAYAQTFNFDLGIGKMTVGCTFIVG